ncbi:hypothetical protein B0H14DRAFT_2190476, partial [Mycena olivaceomarginata]
GSVEPWFPAAQGQEITSNCRYFTVGSNIPAALKAPFHPQTDPNGVLSAHLSDKVAHCADNDVVYMALDDDKLVWYIEKDPATFKTGDIVEMGFVFV